MTLEQFFERIVAKAPSHPVLRSKQTCSGVHWTIGMEVERCGYQLLKLIGSEPLPHAKYLKTDSWNRIVKHTKQTDFWDEFRGMDVLRAELKSWLNS